MSIDISLVIDTGGTEMFKVADVGGYPYYIYSTWEIMLGVEIYDLDGRPAGQCIADLKRAIYRLTYEVNLSDDYGEALNHLQVFLDLCLIHPKTIVRVY